LYFFGLLEDQLHLVLFRPKMHLPKAVKIPDSNYEEPIIFCFEAIDVAVHNEQPSLDIPSNDVPKTLRLLHVLYVHLDFEPTYRIVNSLEFFKPWSFLP